MHLRHAALSALLAVLLALAGCTATFGGAGTGTGTPTLTPAPTPSGTPTATPGACTAVERRFVDPYRDSVEPSAFPERPATLNRSSVEAFAVAYERAYSRNRALRKDSTRVEVAVSDVSVRRWGNAWVVELTSRTNTWAQSTTTANRTATVVHGDGAYVPVRYRLTDRGLYRSEGAVTGRPSSDRTGAPTTESGEPVVCFDR